MPNPRGMPPGAQPNLQQLMKQAQKLQEQMEAAQQELLDAEVTGTAGGGLVTATVSGTGDIRAVTISPDAIDTSDPDLAETLGDLVVAAVRAAQESASQLQEEKLGPVAGAAGGMGGGLPGLPF